MMIKKDRIKINYMSPTINKLGEDSLQLLFSEHVFQIDIGGEAFNFNQSEGRELLIDMNTEEIINKEEMFAFRNDERTLYIALSQLLETTNLHGRISKIIREQRTNKINMNNIKVFEERIHQSATVATKNTATSIGALLIASLMVCVPVFAVAAIGIVTTGILLGTISPYWLGSLTLFVVAFQNKEKIHQWVQWQFIEPFKKYEDDEKK